jgi:hypothetical protein
MTVTSPMLLIVVNLDMLLPECRPTCVSSNVSKKLVPSSSGLMMTAYPPNFCTCLQLHKELKLKRPTSTF